VNAHTLASDIGFTQSQAQLLISKAFDLVDAGDLEGAESIFNGLLVLNPFDAAVHAALGSVLHEQGNVGAAEAAYDEAIRLDAASALARVNRGELRLRRGDRSGVRDLELAAAKRSPVQPRAQYLLRFYAR
jgi:Flp pilus assembly protein TadD